MKKSIFGRNWGTWASPGSTASTTLLPSVVIDVGENSRFTHLNDIGRGAGPYADIQLFQRRHDHRPVIFRKDMKTSKSYISGTVYSKWGHVIFAEKDSNQMRFVAGSMRIINLDDCEIVSATLLTPAEDVFIVQ